MLDPRSLAPLAAGARRALVFRDLVLTDLAARPGATLLDIGCGNGFDGDDALQRELAQAAGTALGLEPDRDMPPPPWFATVHRSLFEAAPLEPASVDVAYCAFVMEHLTDPARFWHKLHEVLRPGGVFWGFTVDRRHYFAAASALLGRLGLKDRYLRWRQSAGQQTHYEHYPTCYRLNTPQAILRQAGPLFAQTQAVSANRLGQLDYYLPGALRGLGRALDRASIRLGLPGSLLVVRAVR